MIQQALILASGSELTPECLSLGELERLLIDQTLRRAHGNKQRAAEILGISRKGIYNKLLRYGIGA